ncbi:hypothetical protein EVAR_48223_1 [Eumeta japonica]|uniref:Uncharacterized protein n=1 Tax=Eumeta variegata TaxID=151549 RepID=A0A4C1YGQ5_EUMVA|nr:hypothetical protein EVAR_48223_1 [Eumeta japonica]
MSHECAAGLLVWNRISDGGNSALEESRADEARPWGYGGENEPPELSLTERNATAETFTSRLYSVRVCGEESSLSYSKKEPGSIRSAKALGADPDKRSFQFRSLLHGTDRSGL